MDLLKETLLDADSQQVLTQAEVEDQCDILQMLSVTPGDAEKIFADALALIRAAPFDLEPQLLAAKLLEKSQRRDDMVDTWAGFHDRFPEVHLGRRYLVRWMNRDGQIDQAKAILYKIMSDDTGQVDLVEFAELCAEIREPDAAVAIFDELLGMEPDNTRLRVIYGKYLFAHSRVYEAFSVLDPVRDQKLSKTARGVIDRNDKAVIAMEAITPMGGLQPQPQSVLRNAFKLFARRIPRKLDPRRINGVTFYTGSLGAGGAERQLTQMASAFHHRRAASRKLAGTELAGRIEVVVNNIDTSRGKDFFLPALKASGIPLSVTADMESYALKDIDLERDELAQLAPLLPRNVRYGLERLVAHFRTHRPDIAYFWQDGAVLTGALAALVAGIPRIVVSLRGLPPNMRPNMMKPEYFDLYQALSEIPGVSFSCNSRCAANAYADWLDLPRDSFSVIYNAVRKLPEDAAQIEQRRWNTFAQHTHGANFTLGGIFRFTPNKRGLKWLEFGARVAKSNPNMRFILVGDGGQLSAAQSHAVTLGIEDRTLFVGSSQSPGFWLSKMDAMCLLSENEGLPNVLIEAQIVGKPVISTPAGGAAETFIDGHSGYLLSSSVDPSIEEFAIYAERLANDVALRRSMGQNAHLSASGKFHSDHIFAQTIRFFLGETVHGDQEDLARDAFIQLQPRPIPAFAERRARRAYTAGAEL